MPKLRIVVDVEVGAEEGEFSLTDYLVDQVTPKVKRQLRRLAGVEIIGCASMDSALFSNDGRLAGSVKLEVDPEPQTMWILRRAEYGDPRPLAVYDDEDEAQKAYERYDEAWGNYDLDEVPLNPEIPPAGNVYGVRLDASGFLKSHPSAFPYEPDHRDLSELETRTVTSLTERVKVYDRYFSVWATDPVDAATRCREEKKRLQALNLWETEGQIIFGEDGPE